MRVERDIAGIALPFAAGIALTAWSGPLIFASPSLWSAFFISILLATSAYLLHPVHRTASDLSVRSAICLCLASCGILCGIRAEITSIGGLWALDSIVDIREMGTAAGSFIDSIGFRNSDTNAIIKALLTGDRADIPVHVTQAFRDSGASHILALSGLHLGIIYGILSKGLSYLGNSSSAVRIRSLITVLTCGLYTLATGAGASIVRAFLFILLGESARLHGRFRSTGTVLLSALVIHLAVDPSAIREVGFQLSYAAMAGIAFIFPWLKGFWPEGKNPLRWIWTTAAMSISCQITTGPLAWFYFGTFPIHFLLTNLIAIPLTGLIIPTALAVLLLSALGICPEMLLRACEMLVTALSQALEIISVMYPLGKATSGRLHRRHRRSRRRSRRNLLRKSLLRRIHRHGLCL